MPAKLDVGAILREVFAIYREQAGVLLPVAFWLFLIVAVVNGLTADDFSLFWAAALVSFAVGTLYQGMVVGLVRDVQDARRDSSIGDLMRPVLPVFRPLLGAGILFGLGVGAGLVLLIVPGLYLLTIWAVVAPVIMVERRAAFEAFGRSRQLVAGQGWQVFKVAITAYLLTALGVISFQELAATVANGPLVRIVFSALASTLTAPITALVAAVLYFHLLELRGQPNEGVGTPSENTPSA